MPKQKIWRRSACLGWIIVIALAAMPGLARAQSSPVEQYVTTEVAAGLSILQDKSLTAAERRQHVHDFLLALLDTKRIALYALGDARQTASQTDLDAYCDAFRQFMAASYTSRLTGYDGQTLKVTGSLEHAANDYIVQALIVDPSDMPGAQEPEVDLRVVSEDGKFYVVDASIEGIWLGLAQHDDFQGFLKQHNNDVAALTAHLKDLTAGLERVAS